MSERRRLRVQSLLPNQPLLRHLLAAGGGAVFFLAITLGLSAYRDFEMGEIALYAIVLAGMSILTGVNGQISLGHGGFMAVGAYTFAILQIHAPMPLGLELIISMAASAALGLMVAMPATRLRGPYLAGMTLILALGLPQLADKYTATFGGDQGLATTAPTPPAGINAEQWLAWIEILCALVVLVLLANLVRSRFGRSMRAVRDNEIAAALAGIRVARTKVFAFVVSASCAGLAGAFLGLSTGVVNTGEFALTLSLYLLAAMVLGGAGSLVGPWWGAVVLVYLPQWSTSISKSFSLGNSVGANLAVVIYGVVLIVVMLAAPSGVQGGLRWLGHRALRLGAARSSPIIGVTTGIGPEAERPPSAPPTAEHERTNP
ncbi:MAG TPA: branched-chain amino acid ABC transporter permease [Acidimicrobiales bacterium]|jgi:branched-chain amino acid transport system permease protein|nr:branched-chain amino acid ABC transporter permease [Acidimicrobiales bacterium]